MCAADMENVKIASDKKGFRLFPSGDRYIPWGHNYASAEVMERLATDPDRVDREFAEMKAAGTTVARIHPEMPRILTGPDKADHRRSANSKSFSGSPRSRASTS